MKNKKQRHQRRPHSPPSPNRPGKKSFSGATPRREGPQTQAKEPRRERERPRNSTGKPGRQTEQTPRENKRSGPSIQKLTGTLQKNKKGFGFLIFQDRSFEDLFLPEHVVSPFFHGDQIQVVIQARTGDVLEIKRVGHGLSRLVGRYLGYDRFLFERKNNAEEIAVLPGHTAKAGHYVEVKLHFDDKPGKSKVTAEILKDFGETLPALADLVLISAEYSLNEEHSAAAVEQARKCTLEWDETKRTDLRHIPFITIDGEDARDFDDAVFVEKIKAGEGSQGASYVLWVAIADVSHYVTDGTPLDQEAYARGTSVYFPERAFHMLPRELSENLCSLRPKEPRLALTARMEIDTHGQTLKTELFDSVIESKRRATYTEIENEKNKFPLHFELYNILRMMRKDRGSIDFDLQELKIEVGPDAEPIRIQERTRLDAHRLIEAFMIAANEAVTEWMLAQHLPFIYRVHGAPDSTAVEKFLRFAHSQGLDLKHREGDLPPKQLSEWVAKFEGNPAKELLNFMLLRSMRQAVYSSEHDMHYGLASQAYTHFTSPIRRYPDLVVHRLLKQALLKKRTRSPEDETQHLETIASHCSQRERVAAEAERECNKLKQVRMATHLIGQKLPGRITGMSENGLFIQLDDPRIEGMIHKDRLTGDRYLFDESKMIFAGRQRANRFSIGDRVQVLVAKADLDRRMIDFDFVERI